MGDGAVGSHSHILNYEESMGLIQGKANYPQSFYSPGRKIMYYFYLKKISFFFN